MTIYSLLFAEAADLVGKSDFESVEGVVGARDFSNIFDSIVQAQGRPVPLHIEVPYSVAQIRVFHRQNRYLKATL
jgi:hypothetical protein